MGSSSAGKKKYLNFRNKQRANMSFFIVVMFFAVFGIIVFTEIFFIDEKDKAVLVRRGSMSLQRSKDRMDYDNDFQGDDYISIRVGQAMMDNADLSGYLVGKSHSPLSEHSPQFMSKFFPENQLPTFPENYSLTDGSWQNVNGTRYKFFVYSAFYDQRRNQRNVRIIAATKTRGPERVWCRLWFRIVDGNSTVNVSKTVPAKLKVIRENWNLRYSACFVMCPLRSNMTVPTAVSVVARLRDPPTNMLSVVNNYNDSVWRQTSAMEMSKFGVCVKPLHFEYNKELQIMEFIELNRLMGVDHFIFYNHTIGPQVSCVLRDYQSRGIVTLLPWKLDMVSQKEIRTEGLFAALNDCLYRSMYRFSHILLIDLDEYIIPNYNETLPQLISYLNRRLNTRSTGSFSFQNAFFYLQWEDDSQVYDFSDPISSNLVTLKKTRRKAKLHPHKQRSKYICRPELVVETGNHFVWEFIPGHGTLNVPADAAILHHYRICEFGGNDCIKTSSTVDKTAYRYSTSLARAVKDRYHVLKDKCSLSNPRERPTRVFHKILNMLKTGSKRKR